MHSVSRTNNTSAFPNFQNTRALTQNKTPHENYVFFPVYVYSYPMIQSYPPHVTGITNGQQICYVQHIQAYSLPIPFYKFDPQYIGAKQVLNQIDFLTKREVKLNGSEIKYIHQLKNLLVCWKDVNDFNQYKLITYNTLLCCNSIKNTLVTEIKKIALNYKNQIQDVLNSCLGLEEILEDMLICQNDIIDLFDEIESFSCFKNIEKLMEHIKEMEKMIRDMKSFISANISNKFNCDYQLTEIPITVEDSYYAIKQQLVELSMSVKTLDFHLFKFLIKEIGEKTTNLKSDIEGINEIENQKLSFDIQLNLTPISRSRSGSLSLTTEIDLNASLTAEQEKTVQKVVYEALKF